MIQAASSAHQKQGKLSGERPESIALTNNFDACAGNSFNGLAIFFKFLLKAARQP